MAEKTRKSIPASRIFLYGIIVKNPILVQVVGLCPAVAASSSLRVAALLASVQLMIFVVCEILASTILKIVPRRIRVAVYMAVGAGITFASMYYLEKQSYGQDLLVSAGIYLPLMAANASVALRCEKFAVKKGLWNSICDAFATGLGAAIVLIISGLIRELLGAGTISGNVIFSDPPVPAMQMPFGGFIILGFLAAFLKWCISIFLPAYNHEMAFKIKRTKRRRAPEREPVKETKAAAVNNEKPQTPPAEKKEEGFKISEEALRSDNKRPERKEKRTKPKPAPTPKKNEKEERKEEHKREGFGFVKNMSYDDLFDDTPFEFSLPDVELGDMSADDALKKIINEEFSQDTINKLNITGSDKEGDKQ
ncbi:MAG: hypothetical protein K6F09_00945 [Clostridiales bacterium]|nr:hypothetical protein [Clostridiales bacterium]